MEAQDTCADTNAQETHARHVPLNRPASRTGRLTVSRTALPGLGIQFALPDTAWGHAMVQRYDLPVPLWYYLTGAGLVVALTFIVLVALSRKAASRETASEPP